jgi:hypothetical protein
MPVRSNVRAAALAVFVCGVAPAALAQAPLWATRDRLLDSYAAERGLADRCDAWRFVTNPANNRGGAETRKYVFLTITHNLWLPYVRDVDRLTRTRPTAAHQERLADHVEALYGVLDDASESCSGLGNNRLYGRFSALGEEAVRDLGSRGIGMYGPMNWRASRDWGGPHAPFTGSRESDRGGPRAQIHYFNFDADARPINRREVERVTNGRAFEFDLDYNWLHDSNPVCTYSGRRGYDRYRSTWGEPAGGAPVEYEYQPGGCAGTTIGPGGAVDAWTYERETTRGRFVAIFGTGFDGGGTETGTGRNAVYFVQANPLAASPSVIAAEVIYDSAGQINVKVPESLRPSVERGPAYVYVIANGRRSNTESIAIR